ncbi:four-carbon acid sugar kinase family protein [Alkalicoccus daliensis]|uniref:Uncharacterized conserved protein YgbK, DUF1537 family n=1 Tax=Alkalicoccus daliensis TaxID=745820 RepID=A0A1H0EXT2_9BACI|nr:four-carbon acid sugar kinase family protein [Alkalicoccus daliensis]SDN87161.1 Uncharacterized conserved protein YgbK, DUF1537 family [Alkalicoccus daliensis]
MNFTIIADDLTGACDTGVQLVDYNLKPSVVLNLENDNNEISTIVVNTDSRELTPEKAYERVLTFCRSLKRDYNSSFIYKKIDSTMRGNIGAEINALYDYYLPDFIFVVPGHPANGRQIINGYHMLNKTLLHQSEVAADPTNPILESDIKTIVEKQTEKEVAHLFSEDINAGREKLGKKLKEFKRRGIHYITVDSLHEEDLRKIAEFLHIQPYKIICAGSAGLLNYIPETFGLKKEEKKEVKIESKGPKLFVIGSMSKHGRLQLNNLLESEAVEAIEVSITKEFDEDEKNRIIAVTNQAFKNEKDIVLYSSTDIKQSEVFCEMTGRTKEEASLEFSRILGEYALHLVENLGVECLFLTGGETAYQVMKKLGVSRLILLDELEAGVPICSVDSYKKMHVITKAGSFGSQDVMLKALNRFRYATG